MLFQVITEFAALETEISLLLNQIAVVLDSIEGLGHYVGHVTYAAAKENNIPDDVAQIAGQVVFLKRAVWIHRRRVFLQKLFGLKLRDDFRNKAFECLDLANETRNVLDLSLG